MLINLIIPIIYLLNLTSILFIVGLIGITWHSKNIFIMLLAIELMFFSLNIQFIIISHYSINFLGYLFCLLNLIIAAVESVIGLTLIILFYKITNSIKYDNLTQLKN